MSGILPLSRPTKLIPYSNHTQSRVSVRSKINLFNVAWLCVFAAGGLTLLGMLAIDSVPRASGPDFATKHIQFMFIGILAGFIIVMPHYKLLQRFTFPLMLLVLGLLVFLLLPGVPDSIVSTRNGARRWISLPMTDFQPSELAKIAYVFTLASYLRYRKNYRTMWGLILPLTLTFIPMGLIVKEPDLGTGLIFLPTFFAVLLAAGAKFKHMMTVIVLGLALAPMLYPVLKDHQKDRIDAMIAQILGDDRYNLDIGFQADRAMTLVGAGGVFGAGKAKAAALVQYNHLPEEHNDMVFAVICCRWGMMGAFLTWGLYAMFALGGLLTAALCRDPFGRLVSVGLVTVIFTQMTINTGMTIGLLPITGMTLPFISYGGSSLVVAWIMVGMIFNIAMRRPGFVKRHSFEYDEPSEDESSFRTGKWRLPREK